jgi:hypothetical protein
MADHRLEQRGAGHARQSKIEHDEVEVGLLLQHLHRAFSGAGRQHLGSWVEVEEQHAQRIGDQRVIVDDQDLHFVGALAGEREPAPL